MHDYFILLVVSSKFVMSRMAFGSYIVGIAKNKKRLYSKLKSIIVLLDMSRLLMKA